MSKLTDEAHTGQFKTAPADEQEICMVDITTHHNDYLNTQHRLRVETGKADEPEVNGGLTSNLVRVK